jgi:large subunit ribosomal protein L21
MYAVIRSGGKQYKVSAGSMVAVERIKGEAGDSVVFDKVLAVVNDGIHVGRPVVEDATVHGTIVAQEKAKKIVVFKKKRRKGYRRTIGHRQLRTRCRIDEIRFGSPVQKGSDIPGEKMMPPEPLADTLQET